MCWGCFPFADAWLEDPDEEAAKQVASSKTIEHVFSERSKSKRSSDEKKANKRWIFVRHNGSRYIVRDSRMVAQGDERTYKPSKMVKAVSIAPSSSISIGSETSNFIRNNQILVSHHNVRSHLQPRSSHLRKTNYALNSRFLLDPIPHCFMGFVISKRHKQRMAESDYEHWGDDSEAPIPTKSSQAPSTRFSGYNSKNGRRAYQYHATNEEKKDSKAGSVKDQPAEEVCAPPPPIPEATPVAAADPAPAPAPAAQPQQQPPPVYYMMPGYPPMQYSAYPQQVACPPPGYYPYPQMGFPCNAVMHQPNPTAAVPVEGKTEDKKEAKSKVKKWQGRTKTEVEEDNMKIAMREGVCAPRKVMPKDLKEDQLVWCVEIDGSQTLRTYATVTEFAGEWKADPRFQDSWYFVREEEKGE